MECQFQDFAYDGLKKKQKKTTHTKGSVRIITRNEYKINTHSYKGFLFFTERTKRNSYRLDCTVPNYLVGFG